VLAAFKDELGPELAELLAAGEIMATPELCALCRWLARLPTPAGKTLRFPDLSSRITFEKIL